MRFKLTHQIFLLFTFVILLSLLIFTLITSQSLDSIYAEASVNSINEYVLYTEDSWNKGVRPVASKYEYIVGNINNDQKMYSDKIYDYLSQNDINVLISNNLDTSNIGNNKASIYQNDKDDFYVVSRVSASGNYMIAFANQDIMMVKKNSSFSGFIIIFGIILLWGNAIIGIWSQQIVARLKRIQKSVTLLPSTQYQKKIEAFGDDEIAELASSIELMRQEIYQNEEIKREMLQNVSHDFKTPIAVIKSYAEAIMDGVETKDGAAVIIKQAEILKNKAIQLLEYNKLEYLEANKEFEDVNMKDLIEGVIDYYRFQTQITFETELDNVYFKGFFENYRTVLTNILDNNIRYAKSKIKITLKENYLEIYNDGPQIEEDFIKTMFKPYEKGNKGQFGLGMAIVKRILTHFELKIDVINHEEGLSFIITK